MKKFYKTPETEIVTLRTSTILQGEDVLEESGKIGPGGNMGNENNNFDENEITSDITSPSGLWDD